MGSMACKQNFLELSCNLLEDLKLVIRYPAHLVNLFFHMPLNMQNYPQYPNLSMG